MSLKSIILASACAAVARAHGTVSGFVTDGTWNQGFLLDYYYQIKNGGTPPSISAWYAENLDNGFVEPNNYGTSDINCHKNSKSGSLTKSVKAGGTIDFQWTEWPHDIGPVLTYVAQCSGDCKDADKTALRWVKIDEEGWDSSTKTWASRKLIDNNNTWTTTVPSTLASGNYVFRHENGAQNYPQCFNIQITGSGTDKPTGTLGVDLYKANDALRLKSQYFGNYCCHNFDKIGDLNDTSDFNNFESDYKYYNNCCHTDADRFGCSSVRSMLQDGVFGCCAKPYAGMALLLYSCHLNAKHDEFSLLYILAYVLMIRRSLKTRSYSMPIVGHAINMSGEIVYTTGQFAPYNWAQMSKFVGDNTLGILGLMILVGRWDHLAFVTWFLSKPNRGSGDKTGKRWRGEEGYNTTELVFWDQPGSHS
ncbi:hypothetical protein GQX73_g7038 [Xylaria multiplex]|uniref:lytic cellulose monooxygenase (C4-dehydrogenating) n=1 Tax=Xylaria multiplex TaxID=323545 RepID=A0A7C8IU57_9PEZI|nr:hypothetical protein GQX73_g7038 [Xylaria multiplex]